MSAFGDIDHPVVPVAFRNNFRKVFPIELHHKGFDIFPVRIQGGDEYFSNAVSIDVRHIHADDVIQIAVGKGAYFYEPLVFKPVSFQRVIRCKYRLIFTVAVDVADGHTGDPLFKVPAFPKLDGWAGFHLGGEKSRKAVYWDFAENPVRPEGF